MTQIDYASFVQLATDMLESAGALVTWTKPADPDPAVTDPWRDAREGFSATFRPYMAFFSVIDAGRGGMRGFMQAFMHGTDILDVNEIGFLSGGCGFTPEQTDTLIKADGTPVQIVAIDKIDPTGTQPVMYFVSVK